MIVYDEVHLLPAPIFRFTADIQPRRRLGLTATLVREDGREGDVFSLIGPKRYDAPWKDIEAQGYIAPADCVEVRVTLTDHERMVYATAEPEDRYRPASTTDTKNRIVERLVERHRGDSTLVIGQYLDQLDELAEHLDVPVIEGSTTVPEWSGCTRRSGAEVPTLVVSCGQSSRRPARGCCRDPGLRDVRVPAGGGAATRADPAPQGRRTWCTLLRRRRARHRRPGLRRAPATLPSWRCYAYRIIDADDVLGRRRDLTPVACRRPPRNDHGPRQRRAGVSP